MEKSGWIDGTQMERHGTTESGTVVRRPKRKTDEDTEEWEEEIVSKDPEVSEHK